MAKKAIESKHELIKFIKALYSDEIQLNFDKYFGIKHKENNIFNVCFPDNKYTLLLGELNLESCPELVKWAGDDYVQFDNEEVNIVRNKKMSEFVSLECIDEYKLTYIDGSQSSFSKEKKDIEVIKYPFKYSLQLPKEIFDESLITVYFNNETHKITLDQSDSNEVLFDSAVKNLKMIFKKDAEYTIYATERNSNGFRVVMIEGKGNICTLRQYFKVI